MNIERVNVYAFPHKGLRNALSQVALLAGNSDYSDPEDLEVLKASASDLFNLLNLHAHSEDDFVLPALEAKVKGSTAENTEEHELLEKIVAELEVQINSISIVSGSEKGIAFYEALTDFQSKYLAHMALEEGEILSLIWEYFTDQDLIQMHHKIMETFSPDQVLRWFKYILPALNPMERLKIMEGFKAAVPTEFFESVMDMLSSSMSRRDILRLERMLNVTADLT
ncbi:MAG: hemerythrin domain-containing protein [Daejeonella sp.]|uniref:hemerythrin domain-containing protein n=1 Tax=Daejeonella sp. TaxID=2805397 RepID=UPI002736EDA8|nr:hemerythrin domain-containing protein [Daejeonella sp.]MDP3469556.1 hemerythrin domain-containing protein [Daejeonella sp.]